MNTLIKLNIAVWAAVLVLSMPAYAGGKPNGPSQGQLQGQAQGQHQGQLQGQAQGQSQRSTNINANISKSKASSRSSANAGAAAYNGGNNLSVTVGGTVPSVRSTGGTTSSTGGSAVAEGGRGGQGGAGGQGGEGGMGGVGTGGSVGDTESSSGGNVQQTVYKEEYPAASAASVYAGYCQRGGSGQTEDGGFSIVNSDALCDLIRVADRNLLAWQQCEAAESSCTEEQSAAYLEKYHEALADADALVQSTTYTGWLGRVFDQLSIPLAIIALLLI